MKRERRERDGGERERDGGERERDEEERERRRKRRREQVLFVVVGVSRLLSRRRVSVSFRFVSLSDVLPLL
jgi:hypothetical protein